MTCIGAMALLTEAPILSQEKVAKILRTHNRGIEAEVIKAGDEQS